ncbi:protein of unknown function [Parapedobacter composti]|uniref:DUF4843 domain-containing protein n=1 Tax=Parapedobacter composti TaxID=623281 RepID=A0A1I1HSX5_9SPHI|nr:DUF4843 domain-containing protein [Parapedobacter composti]SFC27024.1 protein of unknown function [Parapedobacter composti]
MKRNKLIFLSVFLMSSMVGCEKSEPQAFSALPAILFEYGGVRNIQRIDYSFLTDVNDEATIKIPMTINGFAVDYDRPFEVEVVNDTLTTAESFQYQILGGKIGAGKLVDTLYVNVRNTDELEYSIAMLHLRVRGNEHFVPGIKEKQRFRVTWSNQAIMPTWGVYFRTFFSTAGSTQAFRIFVLTTGLTNFTATEFRAYGQAGAEVLGTKFGDYIKQWNIDHPDDILRHDDGAAAGQPIVPLYYTRSKYD